MYKHWYSSMLRIGTYNPYKIPKDTQGVTNDTLTRVMTDKVSFIGHKN